MHKVRVSFWVDHVIYGEEFTQTADANKQATQATVFEKQLYPCVHTKRSYVGDSESFQSNCYVTALALFTEGGLLNPEIERLLDTVWTMPSAHLPTFAVT